MKILWLLLCLLFPLVSTALDVWVRPLVIWHGLGDSHSSPGMLEFSSLIKELHPNIYIHSVFVEENLEADREAGFYGNVNAQVDFVAEQLGSIPELGRGFDAIGFSQGGQFLRAFVERYNMPPVNNLITFGSQHMGVSDIPACRRYDFLCQMARRAAKGAVYSEWAQENVIQAQYYRDPNNYEKYLKMNHFLPDINNEVQDARNSTYVKNFATLNKLVLVLFSEDITVVPKESSWFGSEGPATDDANRIDGQQSLKTVRTGSNIIPMRSQPLYVEDWIGLRKLDERGGVDFDICHGQHMQLGECWKRIATSYIGGR